MPTAREETSRLSALLGREHHAMVDFLVALADFDRRRLWVELGYQSLFSFLQRELRLSAGAAQYRKTAAELIQAFPEVEAALRDGRLCLSSVNSVAKVITVENAAEVLPRFFGKSARDAEFVAASIRPVENPPRRDFIVTPVRPAPAEPREALRTSEVNAAGLPPESAGERGLVPAPTTDAPACSAVAPERPRVKPLDAERARVNMTVSRRLLDKLAAARDALSHSHPGATEETILEVGLDLILERQARRRGLVKKPRKVVPGPGQPTSVKERSGAPETRYVPAAVRRAVWQRDQGHCQWPVEGGGVCGSTVRVQLDHVEAFARGGRSSVEDLRCLCAGHNDLHARQVFGDDWMDRFTRRRCGDPTSTSTSTPTPTPTPTPTSTSTSTPTPTSSAA